MNTNDIIQRLRQVYDVRSDSALAAALDLASSAPSNWRQRNRPPLSICTVTAQERGISLDWLVLGVGEMYISHHREVRDTSGATYQAADIGGRITRFVAMWSATKSSEELIWLEQHLKRTVPEYREWLEDHADEAPASPEGPPG